MFGKQWTPLWLSQPKLVSPFLRLGDEAGIEITKKEKDAEKWMNAVPNALADIHAYWLEHRSNPPSRSPSVPVRREHNVGRNAPCPCGSGKKFKKCCGTPPTLHRDARFRHLSFRIPGTQKIRKQPPVSLLPDSGNTVR